MKRDTKVYELMHRNVYCARPEMTLRALIKELVGRKITGCPVVDDQERLVGTISLADVAVALGFPPEGNPDPRVGDVMVRDVIGLEQTASLKEVIKIILEHRIHRLIITYQGRVTGIISPLDLIGAALEQKVQLLM
ncbi:MAG: CBS domain-containing protein [Candidatus Eremiobacterota bacterium]